MLMAILVLLDSSALAKRGIHVSAWWGLLLLPLYLVLRTRRARSTWALPVARVALVMAYAIAYAPALAVSSRAS